MFKIHREILEVENGAALGHRIDLENANLLIIEADLGYICCGYFNPETIEKLGDRAVVISGAKTLKEMLKKQPSYVSEKARELGINSKMTGRQCLNKLVEDKERNLEELEEGEEPDEIQIPS